MIIDEGQASNSPPRLRQMPLESFRGVAASYIKIDKEWKNYLKKSFNSMG